MVPRAALLFCMISLSACASVPQSPSAPTALSTTPISTVSGTSHTVKSGETLWRIARMYHTDLDMIVSANRIPGSSAIAVGQVLVIPGNGPATSKPAASFAGDDSGFIWPAQGNIITRFKQRSGGVLSKGIDISTHPGQEIVAIRDGKVAFVGRLAGYGETLILEHSEGLSSIYCGSASVAVRAGDEVKQGMVIARVGTTPRHETGTLHFEIRKKHKPQNPLYFLN